MCPVRLLRELEKLVESDPESSVFRGFNGRLVAKSTSKTQPFVEKIKYDQFLRYLSLWFSGVLGTSPKEFRKHFGTQSSRSGGASAAANAVVVVEFWCLFWRLELMGFQIILHVMRPSVHFVRH